LLAARIGGGKFPQREIRRVALVGNIADAPSPFLALEVQAREFGVAGKLGSIEIDAVLNAIGEALAFKRFDHLDLFADVLRRTA